jgi:nitroreductase
MNVFDAIQKRRSVRAYQQRALERGKLQTVVEAIRQAPSAGNLQAYQVHVIRDDATKRALAAAALGQEFLASAPVVLVFCAVPARSAKYGRRGAELYCVQDATVAVAYAQLAATAEGLATCWVGAFDEGAVSRALNLPAGERPVAILPIGYGAENPSPKPRRELGEWVTGWE